MNKNAKNFLIILALTFLGIGLLWNNPVFATVDPLVVQFERTPLFQEANFLPGNSITRYASTTNNSGQTQRIVTEAINYPGFPDSDNVPADDLSRALMIVISKNGTDLYGGSSPTGPKSLYNFYQDSENYLEIYLSDIGNGETIQYDFTISFPYDEGNEWQEKTTYFDILIGSQGETNPTPPSPPSPPGGGGGALPQGLTISSVAETNLTGCQSCSITITWSTSYFSTSQVVYSRADQPHDFDLYATSSYYGYQYSKEGDDGTTTTKVTAHTVTLTGLEPNTTYYYRVVSHASPPTISTEGSFVTLVAESCNQNQTESGNETNQGEENQELIITGGGEGSTGGTGGETGGGNQENGQSGGIVEGQGEGEEGIEQIILGGGITSQGGEEGFTKFISNGLASIIDALRKILGEKAYFYLLLIFIVLFLLWLLLLLLRRKKQKEEETKNNSSGY